MNGVALVGALAIGCGSAAIGALVCPPTKRLAPRVRPYAASARTALGRTNADTSAPGLASAMPGVFGPILRDLMGRVSAVIESRSDDALALALRQAGRAGVEPATVRVQQLGAGAVGAAVGATAAGVVLHAPVLAVGGAGVGFIAGISRTRAGLERAIEARRARARLELYTVNQQLALHVRSGAGAMQAVQRLVERGRGVVVEELADVLTWTRSGMSEPDAFRRAAELTAEPAAARTYRLLAAAVERGVDLANGLLALSTDLRDARREELHKAAVKRRAAMLLPTIGVLAPIMLLFIAAPLPSIVLGNR